MHEIFIGIHILHTLYTYIHYTYPMLGSLTLTASDDTSALCSVQMRIGNVEDFVFTTHPKVVNKYDYNYNYTC